MKPNDWWLTATKDMILREIERECDTIEGSCATVELVERLFPALSQRGAGIDRARSLFPLLASEATKSLKAYCTKGEPKTNRFGTSRPWRWHKKLSACPVCNGTGFA